MSAAAQQQLQLEGGGAALGGGEAAEQLRETNQKYLDTLELLHAERERVADLQVGGLESVNRC